VVNNNLYVLHHCEDAKPQRIWNQDPGFLGSHDVIGHVTIDSRWSTSYRWSFVTCVYVSLWHSYEDMTPQK